MLVKKLAVLAAVILMTGCHCGSSCGGSSCGGSSCSSSYRDAGYGSSYRDADYGVAPSTQVSSVPTDEKGFVDRHPLFSAPRNYYRDSGDNVVVKVIAGTVVGVPVGVAHEVWQIGYGQ